MIAPLLLIPTSGLLPTSFDDDDDDDDNDDDDDDDENDEDDCTAVSYTHLTHLLGYFLKVLQMPEPDGPCHCTAVKSNLHSIFLE